MHFHHYGVNVRNLEQSVAFYQELLNLEIETSFTFMEEKIVFLISGKFRLELIETDEAEKTIHLCFEVKDLLEVMNCLNDAKKLEGPYQLHNGWKTVFYEGPSREIIEFIQTTSAV
ncbi:VOC family protein [Sporosarcina sp. Te-1]|uniref:VOC family protein n=1 Tax=Sporosarcina sp. Te-1 TaxID=2818390 RepID=UPI001A9E39DA|nr:VOC family protein [Sporosarcina sp. Te-1]QTD39525.1 VOC family protein [Sporosarcina sp. Te-1]